MESHHWKAQVFGDPESNSWEISVVRSDNEHGQKSWGWFDERKLLISHNGGPCHWKLAPELGKSMVAIAEMYAIYMNTHKRMPETLLVSLGFNPAQP